jgi:MscS family membrane protein
MLTPRPLLLLVAVVLLTFTPWAAAQNPLTSAAGNADQPTEASIDRSSPRATFESFMDLAGQASETDPAPWDQAAQCLAMPTAIKDQARQRAQLLHEILVKLDANANHLLTQSIADKAGAKQFKFFPQPRYHAWIGQYLPKGRTLDSLEPIVLTRADAGDWRFSESTVRSLPALEQQLDTVPAKAELGMYQTTINWLGPTFERTTGLGWLALLVAIAIALVAGRLTNFILNRLAQRFGRKTWGLRSTILHDAAGPAALLLFNIGLSIGLRMIHTEGTVQTMTQGVVHLLYILAVGWFIYNLVDTVEFALRRASNKSNGKINESIIALVRRTLRVFVIITLLLVIADDVFHIQIAGLLAGLGVAGLAISLAAQESVKNVFGSLTVFFDKALAVGDYVTFGSYTGTVEDIGFRSTRLRLLNGHLVTIPNMKFIDGDIENIGARPYIRRVMDVTITYDTPPDKVQQAVDIVRQILTEDQEVVEQGRFDMTNFPPRIAFDAMNSDNLNIKAYYWYQLERNPDRGYWTYLQHSELVNQKVLERFEQAGIDFAFPTQTLYLAGDEKRQLSVRMLQADNS